MSLTTPGAAGVNIQEALCLSVKMLLGAGDRDKLNPIYERYNLM
jgi:hypothetical protein